MSNRADESIQLLVVGGDARQSVRSAIADSDLGAAIEDVRVDEATVALATRHDCVIVAPDRAGTDAAFAYLRSLREAGVATPVVVVLTAPEDDLLQQAIDAGATDYILADGVSPRRIALRIRFALRIGQAERASAKSLADATAAARARDEVLAIVSHDLRSPLSAINLGTASLLQLHGDQPGSRKRLEILQRSTNRMTHLINDLLDMAALQAKGLSLSITPEDPVQLATRVVEGLEPIAAERGIALVRDLAPIAGPLHCDRDRVEQVFENLIGNAIKYCRSGDSIFVRARSVGASVEYCIADTGPGIAVNEAARIFEPYWSAKRAEAKRGTGLGLYIAKGIVEAHGGSIGVISREGQGATFWFTIPLASK